MPLLDRFTALGKSGESVAAANALSDVVIPEENVWRARISAFIDLQTTRNRELAQASLHDQKRAGEQGRGFAFVAGGVRALAQRSAGAAQEIKSLIGANVERVEAGARLVLSAGATMEEVVTSVRRVTAVIGEVTTATQDQQAGIEIVNKSVETLDRMTQQSTALVVQSVASSTGLRELSTRLTEVVQSFKIN